jgi:adenylate cyclase
MPIDLPSIAVLPFEDLSSDENHLGGGISSEIIYALAQSGKLNVTARTSSFAAVAKNIGAKEIGEMLQVEYLLEGTVRKAGTRIRVTAQLIKVSDGFQLWSEKYEQELTDLFALQDDLSQKISEALAIKLDPNMGNKRLPVNNIEAYNLYLQAIHFGQKWTAKHISKAIDLYKEALALEPKFALCYTGLANCYSLGSVLGLLGLEESHDLSRECIIKALQYDENLADAHIALGLLKLFKDTDLQGSFESFTRGLELNPGLAEAHHVYSFYLNSIGANKEAVEEMEIAVQLDPLSSQINSSYAYSLMVDYQYENALVQFDKTIALDPDADTGYVSKSWVLILQERFEEAEAVIKSRNASHWFLGALGYLYGKTGREEEAQKVINQLEESFDKSKTPVNVTKSVIYMGLNDLEAADREAKKAFDQNYGFPMVLSHPGWREFRSSTYFNKYKKRLGMRHLKAYANADTPRSTELTIIKLQAQTKESIRLPLSDLLYIEAQDNYCNVFYHKEGKVATQLLRATLADLEKQLVHPEIVRCHRSYVVNRMVGFQLKGNSKKYYLTSDRLPETEIPVSRSKGQALSEVF